jgi:hypothetical protein
LIAESQTAPTTSGPRASTLVRGYLILHAAALLAYWFVTPDTWPHPLWQTTSTVVSCAFLVLGARRLQPEAVIGWYLIAAGVFLNGCGVTVEFSLFKYLGVRQSPNLADAFWSSIFPLVVIGLSIFARRAAAREDVGTMLRNTLICVPVTFFAGIYAWQLVAWRLHHAASVPVAYKIVVTAYPFGDLMFLALLLRLVLSLGVRNVSLLLFMSWLLLLVPSDLGWPYFIRTGEVPSRAWQYFMEATWMAGNALLGLATWHPHVRDLSPSVGGRVPPLGTFGWICLLACILTAPLVVLLQLALDHLYSLTSF